MGNLTRNFDREDFWCHCSRPDCAGHALICRMDVVNDIQDVRDFLGEPIIIDRGVSCAAHNKELGGTDDSRHLPKHADALDLRCHSSEQRYRLVRGIIMLGRFTFIEVADKHVHVDKRPGDNRLIIGESK